MKLYTLLLGFLLCGAGAARAQAPAAAAPAPLRSCPTISGHASGSGKPLAGVTVAVPGTRLLTITNGEGFFTLTLPAGTPLVLQFSAAGYEPQTLTPTSCSPVELELQLLPGTRIKQRGKRKGFIMKTTQMNAPTE